MRLCVLFPSPPSRRFHVFNFIFFSSYLFTARVGYGHISRWQYWAERSASLAACWQRRARTRQRWSGIPPAAFFNYLTYLYPHPLSHARVSGTHLSAFIESKKESVHMYLCDLRLWSWCCGCFFVRRPRQRPAWCRAARCLLRFSLILKRTTHSPHKSKQINQCFWVRQASLRLLQQKQHHNSEKPQLVLLRRSVRVVARKQAVMVLFFF